MKVTTRIAISSLKQNKSRSILIAIAVFLTTTLLTILFLSTKALIKHNAENASSIYGNYHASYRDVSAEKLKDIKAHGEFYNVGKRDVFGVVENHNMNSSLAFIDETLAKSINFKLKEGSMPIKKNEIVAQSEFFKNLGYKNPKLGGKVKIQYKLDGKGKVVEKEFVISGIVPSEEMNNLRKVYTAVVSEEFYNETIPSNMGLYTICFKVKGEDKLNYDEIKDKIEKLSDGLGIKSKNIIVNNGYLLWATNPGFGIIATCFAIGALIIFFSIIVIYNIFYAGIIQKVQEYGRLKAIGATKKQMKSIILKEGMIIGGCSIPFGLIIGYTCTKFISFILDKLAGGDSLFVKIPILDFPMLLLASFLSITTVYLSLRKPMKIVCKISPIEALLYQENGKIKGERKGYKSLSLFKLSIASLIRNKKRTITTILTMGLSCMMFVILASIGSSMDPIYSARRSIEKGDFRILLNYTLHDDKDVEMGLNNMQKQNPMGDKFIKSIEDINGVTKVESKKIFRAKVNKEGIDEIERYVDIEVLSKEDFNDRKSVLERGEINYDKALRENGIIYEWNKFFDEMGFSIGEKLDISIYDGDKIIPFDFVLQGSARSSRFTFMITEDTFRRLNLKGNMTSEIFVTCEENQKENVNESLKKLVKGNDKYWLRSFDSAVEESKLAINTMRYPVYGVLFVIGIIGFMNMANTLITSVVVRKRELGILQAIGLTRKQLNKMLQIEGLILTIGTIVVSLVLGVPLGYTGFAALRELGFVGLKEYHFPILELGIMITILILFQAILSLAISKNLQKHSVIDRIKTE